MERSRSALFVVVAAAALSACGGNKPPPQKVVTGPAHAVEEICPAGRPMRVRFYDVAQALAVLVTLPDGRKILIDTGDSSKRPGCGIECATANQHLLAALGKDAGDSIDLLWITHQHSDHLGGVPDILQRFHVGTYVDNGRDMIKPLVDKAHVAADAMQVKVVVVDPSHVGSPIADAAGVRFTPIVPHAWPPRCGDEPNDCSIGLRIDYCKSSVLFVGDAESDEEAVLDPLAPVTLLQVGHHGSDTSSSTAFLDKVKPKYAVISAGRPNAGLNTTYCHPRKAAVTRLNAALGGSGSSVLEVHEGECKGGAGSWAPMRVSERLWATERDGDVVLMTSGDGVFRRE